VKQIRQAFEAREKAIEHEIDHKQLEMHMSLGVACECFSFRKATPATPITPPAQSHTYAQTL
jgi:hypothetical protein